jgi:hypothetical protein
MIKDIEKSQLALEKVHLLLHIKHELITDLEADFILKLIEKCGIMLYENAVKEAKEKYINGKPLC